MKVSGLSSTALSIPVDPPFAGSLRFERMNPVVVEVFTDEGLSAHGIAVTYNDTNVKLLKACVDALGSVVAGLDLFRWAESWERLWRATSRIGHQGFGIYALSAVDSALWNLRARALEMPLASLLGGYRNEVPVYASHKLWRDRSIAELQEEARDLVLSGFRAMKMRMGGQPLKVDIERLAAVREAVGPDVKIMVDVLWAWTPYDAVQMGREMEKLGLYWLEDPIPVHHLVGLADVARALDTPIVVGENISTKYGFRELFAEHAADIAMIDLQAVGGVSEWMKVASLAEANSIPVVSHLFNEFSVHLMAAVPNGLLMEYMPWWDIIYQEPPQPINGAIQVPQKPGIGYELDRGSIARYRF